MFTDLQQNEINEEQLDDMVTDPISVEEESSREKQRMGLTVTFGDVGTTRLHRSVRNSDPYGYKSFTDFPGDLHTGCYLEECFAKTHGESGVFHVAANILKAKKVTPSSFMNEKLKEGNLQRNKEVCSIIRKGYTIAAALHFEKTEKCKEILKIC